MIHLFKSKTTQAAVMPYLKVWSETLSEVKNVINICQVKVKSYKYFRNNSRNYAVLRSHCGLFIPHPKSPQICSEVVVKTHLVWQQWAHMTARRVQAAALCAPLLLHGTTIGRGESRCPRSCQPDAAPLFLQQPEGEAGTANCLMRQNCAGYFGAFTQPGGDFFIRHDFRRGETATWSKASLIGG